MLDIVVASLTKFYTGNGSALGGVLVDGGQFDWTIERNGAPVFPDFVTPDPAYHGLRYADLGPAAFGLKARVGLLRDTGAAPSAFNTGSLPKAWKHCPCALNDTTATPRKSPNFWHATPKSPLSTTPDLKHPPGTASKKN